MLHHRSNSQRRHREEMIVGGDFGTIDVITIHWQSVEHHAPKQGWNGPPRLLASHEEVGRHPMGL